MALNSAFDSARLQFQSDVPVSTVGFAGRTASLLLLFRMKATPGVASQLRSSQMTIQLDRRPLVAGANSGGIKAPSKPFSKLLQNSRVLLQAFPNKSLAVLWNFNGLQVFQTPFDAFQIFRLRPPVFGRILPLVLRCCSVDGAFIAQQRPRSREF